MEGKPKVGLLAALLAEHESREAVSASPLKLSGHAALTYHCGRNTLGIENALQVAVNPGNKFFYVGVFGLRHVLDITKENIRANLLSSAFRVQV
jgi:hypothetical protein